MMSWQRGSVRSSAARIRAVWLAGAAAALVAGGPAWAQTKAPESPWILVREHSPRVKDAAPWLRPREGQALIVDLGALRTILAKAPLEGTPRADAAPLILELPDPQGVMQSFSVVESPILAPDLAARHPEIITLMGQGLTDPMATLRADITAQGFHAQVLTSSAGQGGSWFIDPYSQGDTMHYTSYARRGLAGPVKDWSCGWSEPDGTPQLQLRGGPVPPPATGATLRTFRLAVAATGEYTAFFGGTVAQGQAAIVTAINRVTGVYEVEQCIRFSLVATLVYTDAATDPYTNTDPNAMIGQNQTNINAMVGSANYDIGHVFATAGGGLAAFGVCSTGNKSRGVTGLPTPTGDAFWVDYVCHEIGHQFGAGHSFNGVAGSCATNRSTSSAVEPGSGSTIMAYSGICGSDNIQSDADPYFSFISYQQIQSFVTSGSGACAVASATSNAAPTVTAPVARTLPRGTPFALTATGSDANGDPLTYCWEDRNFGGGTGSALAAPDNGVMPLFRSRTGIANPTRSFPRTSIVLSGATDNSEKIPQVARAALRFRVTARDNRAGGGGINTGDVSLAVSGTAGPFAVTSPSGPTSWTGGETRTITWDVAGTTASNVNVADVAILLSTNAGFSFTTTLLASTPNDGSETIVVPAVSTSTGRIMVQSIGNYFYAINAGSISILPSSCEGADISTQPTAQSGCLGGNATFVTTGSGTAPLSYQWRRNGVDIASATAPSLTINPVLAASVGGYSVVVSNACGGTTSATAALTVCIADFNCSGAVGVQDIFDFLAAYFADDQRTDVNASGGISVQDIFDFLALYFTGC